MSKCQDFLTVHANNLLVTRKTAFKSPVQPSILIAYMSDQELKASLSDMVHSRDILYMPVHVSPLFVYLNEKPWHYRYTTSFKMLSELYTIIRAYSNPKDYYYMANEKRINEAIIKMMNDMTESEDFMYEHVKGNLGSPEFISFMQHSTITRIQLVERCLHSMFDLPFPVEFILTPAMFPPIDALQKEDQSLYYERMEHWYNMKQSVANERIKKESGTEEYVDKKYFPSLGSKNYEALLHEYYVYLKLNE